MEVVSTGPLRVASTVWQPRPGAWALTVVCKATFHLQPGVSALAEAQDAPLADDVPWDDAAGSVRAPGDLAPFKARADVLLVGHAFAPPGQTARLLPVRLQAGALDKRIDVWCDRIFWHEGRLLEGQPFSRMPLRWERAAGGPMNPVGMRFDAPPDAHGAVPIPNLQPPGVQVARRGDTFAPTGFGPISASWPGRAAKLGRHAAGWIRRPLQERPLPEGLDRAYFNAAPPDQQVATIEPDERIVLEHLHPEHARLETTLPGVRPVARMTAGGRAGEEITLVADTLWIDTDRGLACLVWRGRVPLAHAAEEGRVSVSASDGGEAVGATLALGPGSESRGPVLPFGAAGATPVEAPPAPMATLLGGRPGGVTLPFARGKSPWEVFKPPPAAIQAPPAEPADTGTLFGVSGRAHGVLPTAWAAPSPAREAPIVELEIDDEETPPVPERAGPEAAPAEDPPAPAPAPPPVEVAAESDPVTPVPATPAVDAAPPEVPIERCAAIAASIARRPADRAKILEDEQLSAGDWTKVERRWDEALRDEGRRGKRDLLAAYDTAYVGRLEEERGPIEVAEYARLVVAAERGTAAEALAELGLPRGAMVRIERVWLKKALADPALGAATRKAVKAARQA